MRPIPTHWRPTACNVQTLADIMSATIPCARLYAWIGHVLLPKQMDSSNPYMGEDVMVPGLMSTSWQGLSQADGFLSLISPRMD